MATFDFPQRKVYLRKSGYFDRPDARNTAGLTLHRNRDAIELSAVDPEGPAAQAGLKKGDVLMELNGQNAAKAGLFELYSMLCNGGELTCVVRRDSQELRVSVRQ